MNWQEEERIKETEIKNLTEKQLGKIISDKYRFEFMCLNVSDLKKWIDFFKKKITYSDKIEFPDIKEDLQFPIQLLFDFNEEEKYKRNYGKGPSYVLNQQYIKLESNQLPLMEFVSGKDIKWYIDRYENCPTDWNKFSYLESIRISTIKIYIPNWSSQDKIPKNEEEAYKLNLLEGLE